MGASKHYFYETIPSMANPLGIGNRCMPLAAKVQNLLIADFLNYLAMRHQVYLSTMDEVLKKLQEQALTHDGIIDSLADLDVDIQSFDIPRDGERLSRPGWREMVDKGMVQWQGRGRTFRGDRGTYGCAVHPPPSGQGRMVGGTLS